MTTIGRNEPCLCGSGKKYKKCCGKAGAVHIDELVAQELDTLQAQLYDYIATTNSSEIEAEYHAQLDKMAMMKADQDVFEMAFVSWYGVSRKLEDGTRLIDGFIEKHSSTISRPQTKEIVESWKDVRLTAGSVKMLDDKTVIVTEVGTGETLQVKEKFGELEAGSFFLGILLPYKDSYLPFAQYFIYPTIEEAASEIVKNRVEQDQAESLHDYLCTHYLTLADLSFVLYSTKREKQDNNAVEQKEDEVKEVEAETAVVEEREDGDDSDWMQPSYQEAFDALNQFLQEKGENSQESKLLNRILEAYLSAERPTIRNPKIYSAAVVDVTKNIDGIGISYLQKDLAEAFGVSANSISRRSKQIWEKHQETIMELMKQPV
jgi:uncharacterized protein